MKFLICIITSQAVYTSCTHKYISNSSFRHGETNQARRPDKTARQSSFVIIVSSLLVTGINSIGRSVARCISGFSTNWNNRAYLCILVVNPVDRAKLHQPCSLIFNNGGEGGKEGNPFEKCGLERVKRVARIEVTGFSIGNS